MRPVTCRVVMALAALAATAQAETIWIEGEKPAESSVTRHPWYAQFDPAKLSAGDLLVHMDADPREGKVGEASYRFQAAEGGEYRLWLRANHTGNAKLSWRLDGGAWVAADTSKAQGGEIAAPGNKVDLRWLGWLDLGAVKLGKGPHALAIRFESPEHGHHGALDCIVLSTEEAKPWERLFEAGARSPQSSRAALHDRVIWVEGERPVVNQMAAHPWWYEKLEASEMSGGAWIAHFQADKPGMALYRFEAPQAGSYRLWVRANPAGAKLSRRLNDGQWAAIDMGKATDQRNVALDDANDLRFIAWVDAGTVTLRKGVNALAFRTESANSHHGILDCFALAAKPFVPEGARKPGETRTVALDEAHHWRFLPGHDDFSPDALLDLRSLNEAHAGEHGFISLSPDGGHFVRGDGQPIRFWAVNTYVWRDKTDQLPVHARFLAKRGVNMVRYHSSILDRNAADLEAINAKERDQLWRFVATMKKEGIYMTLSPYYAHSIKVKPEWGLGADQPNPTGLLFFHPKVQAAYKRWLREIFVPPNPYTGLPLKDEPAIAIIQIQNEDSLLFWTMPQIKAQPLQLLQKQFGDWAAKEHGSLDQAMAAWQGEKVQGDDLAAGRLAFRHIWDLTEGGIKQKGKPTARLADQAQFLTETMRAWHTEVVRFLRKDLGARQLVNAGNWRTADTVRLGDLERYAYTATEVLGTNRYTGCLHLGPHRGWAIVNGDRFDKPSRLTSPLDLPVNLKQVAGHPIIIPESLWVPPTYYQAEGPFLVAAYASLTGVDTFYWFATGEVQWRQPFSANGFLPSIGKWVLATPEILGNFPAAALLYRKGYLRRGEPVVREHRALEDMWRLRVPLISEEGAYDPNRDPGDYAPRSAIKQEVDRLAFLVGPVEVTYGSDPAKSYVHPKLGEHIRAADQVVRSVTGELALDYAKGLCTMNAPKAQGVAGFLSRVGTFELADVTIRSGNEYAAVIVVAMDDQPLRTSRRVLVQAGTACRPTGWAERPVTWTDDKGQKHDGFEVVRFGKAPWQVVRNDVTISVRNAAIAKAIALDPNGMPKEALGLERDGEAASFALPPNRKYVVLMAE